VVIFVLLNVISDEFPTLSLLNNSLFNACVWFRIAISENTTSDQPEIPSFNMNKSQLSDRDLWSQATISWSRRIRQVVVSPPRFLAFHRELPLNHSVVKWKLRPQFVNPSSITHHAYTEEVCRLLAASHVNWTCALSLNIIGRHFWFVYTIRICALLRQPLLFKRHLDIDCCQRSLSTAYINITGSLNSVGQPT
jgi:hypothetical protein